MVFRLARMRTFVGLGSVAIAVAVLLTIGSTAAMAAGSSPMTKVAQGTDPASLPGSTVFGDTPPSTPETVSFVLRAQDVGQLEASVTNGASHFLTVNQFASSYGQSPATIAALEGYLGNFGISTQCVSKRPRRRGQRDGGPVRPGAGGPAASVPRARLSGPWRPPRRAGANRPRDSAVTAAARVRSRTPSWPSWA